MKLSELSIGSTATILRVGGAGALRQHFFGHGADTGNGGHCRKICTDGRSGGIAYPRL